MALISLGAMIRRQSFYNVGGCLNIETLFYHNRKSYYEFKVIFFIYDNKTL